MKINPDKQFEPNFGDLIKIAKQYDFVPLTFTKSTTGIENTTIIIETKTGKYVIRIYRQGKKNNNSIRQELDFMQYLHANGVAVPGVLPNKSNELISVTSKGNQSWQVIVMEFVEGIHAASYSRTIINELASIQAKLHILSSTYTPVQETKEKLTILHENNFLSQIDIKCLANAQLRAFLQRAKEYIVALDPSLPNGLCHLDYDKDNSLSKNDSITAILDFDDLAVAPFVVCLSYTLWHVHRYGGVNAAQKYLNAYQTIRPLSSEEKRYIRPVKLFRHYVISSLKVLYKHTSLLEIEQYLDLEKELFD